MTQKFLHELISLMWNALHIASNALSFWRRVMRIYKKSERLAM